jgi:hypothetical protein
VVFSLAVNYTLVFAVGVIFPRYLLPIISSVLHVHHDGPVKILIVFICVFLFSFSDAFSDEDRCSMFTMFVQHLRPY